MPLFCPWKHVLCPEFDSLAGLLIIWSARMWVLLSLHPAKGREPLCASARSWSFCPYTLPRAGILSAPASLGPCGHGGRLAALAILVCWAVPTWFAKSLSGGTLARARLCCTWWVNPAKVGPLTSGLETCRLRKTDSSQASLGLYRPYPPGWLKACQAYVRLVLGRTRLVG